MTDQPDADPIGYADALDELDTILRELEGSDVDVDRLADRVARAADLIALCRDRIGNARLRIDEVIADLDAGSEPATRPTANRHSLRAVTAEAPPSLRLIADRVAVRLDAVLVPELERWASLDPDLRDPMAEIRRLVLSGGKRLRPAFCHWGYVAAGGDPDAQIVIDAGAAFELMHAFALFHDDVMDDAASRRGEPTTHTVFAERHAAEGWTGESRRFGEGVAILIGDLAFVYADRLLAGANPTAWRSGTNCGSSSTSARCSTSSDRSAVSATSHRPSGSADTSPASTRSSARSISAQRSQPPNDSPISHRH